jgi:O-antigen ligase
MPLKIQRLFLYLAYAIPLVLIIGRAPADILLCIVTLGFLAHSALTKNFKWLCTPWMRLALITWLYLILSGMLAVYDVKLGVEHGMDWIRFPVFAIGFSTWLLPMDPEFKILRRYLVALLSLIALDALFQFITGHDVFGFARTAYMGRLTGPFGQNNMVVGLFLLRLFWPATGLIFALMWREHTDNKKYLILPLLFVLLMGVAILLSGERMSFVLFIISSGFFFFGAKGVRKAIFAAGSAFMILAVILVLSRADLYNRFVTFTAPVVENFTKSSYGAVFENAITAWKISPVTGVGPKNFFAACVAEGIKGGFIDEAPWDNKFSCARHPHNPYLEWLTETGIIGLALFFGLIGMWGKIIWQNLRQADLSRYYTVLGFGIGLIPFLWPFMATTSFFTNWSALLFWWVLGLNLNPAIRVPKE